MFLILYYLCILNIATVFVCEQLKQGESIGSVREKIQKKVDVPDKEFEKYRLAIVVMGRHSFLSDGDHINIADFRCHSNQGK